MMGGPKASSGAAGSSAASKALASSSSSLPAVLTSRQRRVPPDSPFLTSRPDPGPKASSGASSGEDVGGLRVPELLKGIEALMELGTKKSGAPAAAAAAALPPPHFGSVLTSRRRREPPSSPEYSEFEEPMLKKGKTEEQGGKGTELLTVEEKKVVKSMLQDVHNYVSSRPSARGTDLGGAGS